MKSLIGLSFAGLLALSTTSASAANQRGRGATPVRQPDLHAMIVDAAGRQIGTAEIGRTAEGLIVAVDVNAMPAGRYGVHLHSVGRCDAPSFESAGPHWNPTAMHHGIEGTNGPHMGDLPNLAINANGRGFYQFLITDGYTAGARNALMDADGASIVIHAGEDDYRTDPSGNSGARIACGVLRVSG